MQCAQNPRFAAFVALSKSSDARLNSSLSHFVVLSYSFNEQNIMDQSLLLGIHIDTDEEGMLPAYLFLFGVADVLVCFHWSIVCSSLSC